MKNNAGNFSHSEHMYVKVLAVFLSIAMIWLFCFPTSALAEDASGDTITTTQADAPQNDTQSSAVQPSATSDGAQTEEALSGEGTQSDPYQISSVAQLETLAASVNGGTDTTGKYFELTSDIDLSGISTWTPIGNGTRSHDSYTGNAFKGVFNGNGHTIKDFSLTGDAPSADSAMGLFGVLDGATVSDLTFSGVSINVPNSENIGTVCGVMVNNSTVSNVEVNGSLSADRGLGGVVGRMMLSGTISKCTNNATIAGTGNNVGGIVGAAYYTAADNTMTIASCANTGTLTSTAGDIGGIVGLSAATVQDCTNSGAITGSGTCVAGIAGEQQNAGSVSGCANSGAITNNGGSSAYGTGGVIGWLRYNGASTDYAAKNIIEVADNSNTAAVSGGSDAGGIVGTVYNSAEVTGNTNEAPTLSAANFAAGIVGNYQTTEQPVQGTSGSDIPQIDLTVSSNASTTPFESITASNKSAIVYLNTTGEGVTVQDNASNIPDANVSITVPDAGANVQVTNTSGLEAEKAQAQSDVQAIINGKTPDNLTSEQASQIADIVKTSQSNNVKVNVAVSSIKLDTLPTGDAPLIKGKESGADEVASYDVSVNLTVQGTDSQNVTNSTTVQIHELPKPITFSITVPPASIDNAYVQVITVHKGRASEADVVSIDRSTGVIEITSSKFSTYTVTAQKTLPVVFDSQGGSAVLPETVQYGDKATQPAAPTRDGYTFVGWSVNQNGTPAYNFSDPVEEPLTLYAQWKQNSPADNPAQTTPGTTTPTTPGSTTPTTPSNPGNPSASTTGTSGTVSGTMSGTPTNSDHQTEATDPDDVDAEGIEVVEEDETENPEDDVHHTKVEDKRKASDVAGKTTPQTSDDLMPYLLGLGALVLASGATMIIIRKRYQ